MALLEVENLKVHYPVRGSWFRPKRFVRAVDGVSFSLEAGETVGLVGESGCGKSTLGRALVRLEEPTAGRVLLDGKDMAALHGRELRRARRNFQMIFQDPYGSLNPRLTVWGALDEVLALHSGLEREARRRRAVELLDRVGLPAEALYRYPHQFSGGQRQRIGIARALAAEPRFIVADEPVSALDVTIQKQIMELMVQLQEELQLSILFISHDLNVIYQMCDRVLVMKEGRIVENAETEELFAHPQNDYTKELLAASPEL